MSAFSSSSNTHRRRSGSTTVRRHKVRPQNGSPYPRRQHTRKKRPLGERISNKLDAMTSTSVLEAADKAMSGPTVPDKLRGVVIPNINQQSARELLSVGTEPLPANPNFRGQPQGEAIITVVHTQDNEFGVPQSKQRMVIAATSTDPEIDAMMPKGVKDGQVIYPIPIYPQATQPERKKAEKKGVTGEDQFDRSILNVKLQNEVIQRFIRAGESHNVRQFSLLVGMKDSDSDESFGRDLINHTAWAYFLPIAYDPKAKAFQVVRSSEELTEALSYIKSHYQSERESAQAVAKGAEALFDLEPSERAAHLHSAVSNVSTLQTLPPKARSGVAAVVDALVSGETIHNDARARSDEDGGVGLNALLAQEAEREGDTFRPLSDSEVREFWRALRMGGCPVVTADGGRAAHGYRLAENLPEAVSYRDACYEKTSKMESRARRLRTACEFWHAPTSTRRREVADKLKRDIKTPSPMQERRKGLNTAKRSRQERATEVFATTVSEVNAIGMKGGPSNDVELLKVQRYRLAAKVKAGKTAKLPDGARYEDFADLLPTRRAVAAT